MRPRSDCERCGGTGVVPESDADDGAGVQLTVCPCCYTAPEPAPKPSGYLRGA